MSALQIANKYREYAIDSLCSMDSIVSYLSYFKDRGNIRDEISKDLLDYITVDFNQFEKYICCMVSLKDELGTLIKEAANENSGITEVHAD